MKKNEFPEDIQPCLLPEPEPHDKMLYYCLGCHREFDILNLLYTCPECGGILLLRDKDAERLNKVGGKFWQRLFDYRKMLNHQALKGVFLFYEFIAPVIPLRDIIYLGEGHTPLVKANKCLRDYVGADFYFKHDGLNPSASFKDRGMACALSFVNYLARQKGMQDIIAICASTGDTSASAALYASYMGDKIKSAVILPAGKVTPQQLAQPLGSGAKVIEIPGVFDDCMKVVEALSCKYNVVLLNSKNSWRILGQESFAYEIAQGLDYDVEGKAVFVPIGNAGNISAVLSGFLKFFHAGVINSLPKIIGVQSEHADPVFQYYRETDPDKRKFVPVAVKSSVAQAAMIGNPVSMPRVIELVNEYNLSAGEQKVFVVQVTEQEIMDAMIVANRNGNIACTQGGESLAGLIRAMEERTVMPDEVSILDSTAHILKFAMFQNMYFNNEFTPEYNVTPKKEFSNVPVQISPEGECPLPGKPLENDALNRFVDRVAEEVARKLQLKKTT